MLAIFPTRPLYGILGFMASVETSYLDRLLEPVTQCFTAEVAKRLISLPPDPTVQARIAELAEKANEGQLSDVSGPSMKSTSRLPI